MASSFIIESKKIKTICDDIISKRQKPIYYLTGTSDFYIDEIVNCIEKSIIPEEYKSLNQRIIYGKETDLQKIVMWSKQYPMISDLSVIIVKEAQHLKGINQAKMIAMLGDYIENPRSTTVLCFAHKEKKLLGTTKLAKMLKLSKNVCYYESNKLKDWEVENWIKFYVESNNKNIKNDAVSLLYEHVGNNMTKIAHELHKIFSIFTGSIISINEISKYVGISKEYNTFEFVNYILLKDFYRVIKIVNYFSNNPKNFSMQPLVETLYRTLVQLLSAIKYSRTLSPDKIAVKVGISPFVLKKYYMPATRKYSYIRVINAIENLAVIDRQVKGIKSSSMKAGDLLKDFILKFIT